MDIRKIIHPFVSMNFLAAVLLVSIAGVINGLVLGTESLLLMVVFVAFSVVFIAAGIAVGLRTVE